MDIKALRNILQARIGLNLNDDFRLQKCWEQMADILSTDITSTISFIENECTDSEFFWLSEVFEDVAQKTQSHEFITAIEQRLNAVRIECYHQDQFADVFIRANIDYKTYINSILTDIECAKSAILED